MKLQWFLLVLGVMVLELAGGANSGMAQVTPATDGTGTVVTKNVNEFVVTEGTPAGTNVFHSFEQFSALGGESVNFIVQPNVENVLARVSGGEPSRIDGLLKVSGGLQTSLYLMNPAGILFGGGAKLDIPGSFLATTANGMRFGDNGWFSAVGANNYPGLTGNPDALAFTLDQPGVLVNIGDLSVLSGNSVALTGGVVINTGIIKAPGGQVSIQAVPGKGTVELREKGKVLGFSFNVLDPGNPIDRLLPFTPATLPKLLTGGGRVIGVIENPNYTIPLFISPISTNSSLLFIQVNGTIVSSYPENIAPGESGTLVLSNGEISAGKDAKFLAENISFLRTEFGVGGDLKIDARKNATLLSVVQSQSDALESQTKNIIIKSAGKLDITGERSGNSNDRSIISLGNIQLDAKSINVTDSSLLAGGNIQLSSQDVVKDRTLNIINSSLLADRKLQITSQGIVSISETKPDTPIRLESKGEVVIAGKKGINIDVLSPSQSLLRSGGNLTLTSPELISANIKIASGGDFSAGSGRFTQSNSSGSRSGIVSSNGDVSFGNYEGPSLKVEAKGSIRGGNIRIIGSGNFPVTIQDSDLQFLNSGPALVLRAGLSKLNNAPEVLPTLSGTSFAESVKSASLSTIDVGNINTSIPREGKGSGSGGAVILDAPGNISVGKITTSGRRDFFEYRGGLVDIMSVNGNISTGSIFTGGGVISIVGENIKAEDIGAERILDTVPDDTEFVVTHGRVNLIARSGNIEVNTIVAARGGLNVNAAKLFKVLGVDADASRQAVDNDKFGGQYLNKRTLKIKDAPDDVIDYFISLGYRREDLKNAEALVTLEDVKRTNGIPVSIVVNAGDKNGDLAAPIKIQHGGRSEASFTSSKIEISGKGGDSGLLIGPKQVVNSGSAYVVIGFKNGERFVSSIPNDFDLNNSSFPITLAKNIDLQPEQIPEDSSGLAGVIFIGNFNGSFVDSVQNKSVSSLVRPKDTDRQTTLRSNAFNCNSVSQSTAQVSSKNNDKTISCGVSSRSSLLKVLSSKDQ
jgi:filamentous hemagglutinin family protein